MHSTSDSTKYNEQLMIGFIYVSDFEKRVMYLYIFKYKVFFFQTPWIECTMTWNITIELTYVVSITPLLLNRCSETKQKLFEWLF